MLYAAYGMNSNIDQMASRCPNAISIGRFDLKDHRLVFRGCADVEVSEGDVTQCVLWEITPECEAALDILEGFPDFYGKKYVDIQIGDENHEVMLYYMVGGGLGYRTPNVYYQNMLEEGYADHGLDLDQIYCATGFDPVWHDKYNYT